MSRSPRTLPSRRMRCATWGALAVASMAFILAASGGFSGVERAERMSSNEAIVTAMRALGH
ncbi:MAG: hypothetical protein ACU0CI_02520 [Shimia sp.]